MTKVFVSYARDAGPGENLATELQNKLIEQGYEVFRDVTGLKPGDQWFTKLEHELETSDLMVLVVSEKALISKWIYNEANIAEELGLPVIPIMAENTRMPLWLRHLQVIDFSYKIDWVTFFHAISSHVRELEPALDSNCVRESSEIKYVNSSDNVNKELEPKLEPELTITKEKSISNYTHFAERVDRAVKVFISYSHKDKQLKENFFDHMSPLVRADKVTVWNDSAIDIGSDWNDEIIESLKNADLVVCLVSSSFIASDFCYLKEFTEALDDHRNGLKKVIPVRVRRCFWDPLPIAKIQSAPSDWITSCENQDEAWTEVIQRISEYVEKESKKNKQEYETKHKSTR